MEANFLVGIDVIVLGCESCRICVTWFILKFFILDKSCSRGTGALGLRNIFTHLSVLFPYRGSCSSGTESSTHGEE